MRGGRAGAHFQEVGDVVVLVQLDAGLGLGLGGGLVGPDLLSDACHVGVQRIILLLLLFWRSARQGLQQAPHIAPSPD
jgi:hypothetical protein